MCIKHSNSCDELFENSEDPNPVSHVTCVIWSQHGFFYIGTDVGTVKTLMVQGPATETDDTKHELVWGSESFRYVTCATNLIYRIAGYFRRSNNYFVSNNYFI